jgi:hypothetical protein
MPKPSLRENESIAFSEIILRVLNTDLKHLELAEPSNHFPISNFAIVCNCMLEVPS